MATSNSNDGKKRTKKQWDALLQKEEAQKALKEEVVTVPGFRYGVCECGCGTFTQKIVNREIVRTCKKCFKEEVV